MQGKTFYFEMKRKKRLRTGIKLPLAKSESPVSQKTHSECTWFFLWITFNHGIKCITKFSIDFRYFFIRFIYFAILFSTKYSSPQMDWFSVLFMPLTLAHCCNDRIFHWIFSHNHLRDVQKSFILSVFLYVTTTDAFSYVTDIASVLKSAKHVPMGENSFRIENLSLLSVFSSHESSSISFEKSKAFAEEILLWPSITFEFQKKCNWFWDRVGINRSRQIHLSIPKMDDTHFTELWKSQEALFNPFKQFKLSSYLFWGKKVCSR